MNLLIAISFLCFSAVCVQGFRHTVVAPKAFRLGAVENVILNLHGYTGVTISAYLQDLPNQQNVFNQINMDVLAAATNDPIVLPFEVGSQDILDFRNRQKVLMVIQVTNSNGGDFTSSTEVLVSGESGYLFIRTDRPIYRPAEKVLIQVAPLDQMMAPEGETIVTVTVKTPDGIGVFRRPSRLPSNSFLELRFDIPERPQIGIWFAEAAYTANGYETTIESKFRIDRYVLPTFNVAIELDQPFILPSDQGIFGRLLAHYSYGETVDGSYYLRMRLKRTPDSTPVLFFQAPGQFFRTRRIQNGLEVFEVPIQDVTDIDTIENLIASKGSVLVEAVVTADDQGLPLEATSTPELPFLRSPFVIDTSSTSLFFTPGLAYQVRAQLLSAVSGKPISEVGVDIIVLENGVETTFESMSGDRGEIYFQLDFIGATPKTITIRTKSSMYQESAQMNVTFFVLPYISDSGEYLQITSTPTPPVGTVGQSNFFLTFSFSTYTPEIRFLVVARGSIVYSGTNRPVAGSVQSTEQLLITQDMVPNARVVAYYLVGEEVVSNSFWFDVTNQCNTELTVSVPNEVIPGTTINFNIEGEPNALVTVSAVDRAAYFLFNETRITRDTMFDAMGDYDQGCVRNGGSDTRNVYINAGLVISNPDIVPSLVNNLNCPYPSRKKRAIEEETEKQRRKRQAGDIDVELQSVIDAFLVECDRDGRLPSTIPGDDCITRASRVRAEFEEQYQGCWRAFRNACFEAERERQLAATIGGGRTSASLASEEIALAQPRIDFRESLIFTAMRLDSAGQLSFQTRATDSITTYEVDSLSMAGTPNGFCVSETENIRIFKNIFVQVFVPFSIKIREQAVIRMALFNYGNKTIDDLVIRVHTASDLCSNYQSDITDATAILASDVSIRQRSELGFSIAVFPIAIPAGGLSEIIVQVSIPDGNRFRVLDEIRRTVLIEEAGIEKETYGSFALDVSNGKPQDISFEFAFPEHFIPGTRQCHIFGYTNFLGPTIEVDPVSGEPRDVDSVFRMPRGCGEQNMIRCGPNIYGHMYLEAAGQLSPDIQPNYDASIARIEGCYTRQLGWRSKRTDPQFLAFAVWDRSQPNLWLNAFTVKVFARAKQYVADLDVGPLCTAITWMIGEQDSTGFFNERYRTHHREMKGAVQGRRTLAAYTLISLEESAQICPGIGAEINASTTLVMNYLVANKDHETFQRRPYSLALLAYALALDNPTGSNTIEINDRLLALHQTTSDNRQVFWRVRTDGSLQGTDLNPYWYRRTQAIDVEATAYALLAQVQIARGTQTPSQAVLDFTRKIVHWLIGQRNDGGAFISTQDTVIALQALATYEVWINSLNLQQIPTSMDVSIRGGPMSEWKQGSEETFMLDESNEEFKHEVLVPTSVLNGIGVDVTVSGHGEGMLSYRCTYKTLVNEEGCHFLMEPTVVIKHSNALDPESLNVYTLQVHIAKVAGDQAEQSVVVIGLMTGFIPDERSVAAIAQSTRVDGIAQRYDITDQTVILYFDEITEAGVRFNIDLIQTLEEVLPQPAEIRVLDYYEPSLQCAAFYSLPEALPFLRTTNCEADADDAAICNCAEGGCATCRSRDAQLDSTSCLSGDANCRICTDGNCENMFRAACQRNYVYLVNVTKIISTDNIFVFFEASVKMILKSGDDASVARDSIETFMVRSDCFTSCQDDALEGTDYITEDRELVVMGNKIDVSRDRNGVEMHLYDLDASAILERYIPESTCNRRRASYERSCEGVDLNTATDRIKERCTRFGKFVDACNNFDLLAARLNEGCD